MYTFTLNGNEINELCCALRIARGVYISDAAVAKRYGQERIEQQFNYQMKACEELIDKIGNEEKVTPPQDDLEQAIKIIRDYLSLCWEDSDKKIMPGTAAYFHYQLKLRNQERAKIFIASMVNK